MVALKKSGIPLESAETGMTRLIPHIMLHVFRLWESEGALGRYVQFANEIQACCNHYRAEDKDRFVANIPD